MTSGKGKKIHNFQRIKRGCPRKIQLAFKNKERHRRDYDDSIEVIKAF